MPLKAVPHCDGTVHAIRRGWKCGQTLPPVAYTEVLHVPTVHRSSCLSLGPHPGGSKLAFCPPAIGMEAQHSAIKMDKKTIMRGRWLSQIPVTTNANIRSAGACWKLLVLGCSAVGILRHPHSRPQCRVEMPPLNSVQQARVL